MPIQCTANVTSKRFARTLVEAFGPYAGRDPVYGPEDDVNTPYNLGDLAVMAVSAVALVVVLALLATGN